MNTDFVSLKIPGRPYEMRVFHENSVKDFQSIFALTVHGSVIRRWSADELAAKIQAASKQPNANRIWAMRMFDRYVTLAEEPGGWGHLAWSMIP